MGRTWRAVHRFLEASERARLNLTTKQTLLGWRRIGWIYINTWLSLLGLKRHLLQHFEDFAVGRVVRLLVLLEVDSGRVNSR